MSENTTFIAVDLGAESGRIIRGNLVDKVLSIDEIYRFPNIPVLVNDGLHWDILRLWNDILEGLTIAVSTTDNRIESIGVDTWGVDFGLLDCKGSLIANPFHYRDARTDGMMETAFKKMSKQEIFDNSGIQFMQLNSLYQLVAMIEQNSPVLEIAKTFLTIPDILNYWLTGQAVSEFSIASTTQCFNPITGSWSEIILNNMGIPLNIFPKIVAPGTKLGKIKKNIAKKIGAEINIIAPACHDTGSAVAAIPSESENFAWISSGTWSIMGINLPQPVITSKSLENNFTNEGGVGGLFRFSKNIMGLWLVQECRRTWQKEGQDFTYSELASMAENVEPHLAIIDVDHPDFLKPGDMPARIREFCRQTGQRIPQDSSSLIRITLEGIALKYRWVLDRLEEQTGKALDTIHIIGGGTQNRVLNQFTADATGRKVITGPVEATAIGNILTQADTSGFLKSPSDVRDIVTNSFDTEVYIPVHPDEWEAPYMKLKELIS